MADRTRSDRPLAYVIFPRQAGRRTERGDDRNDLSSFAMRPVPLYVLGALIRREGWDVRCIEESRQMLPDERPDLVLISVWTCLAPSAYDLARRYREDGVPVVLGGIHPSIMPSEALRHADSVVVGEAEGVMPTLMADAAAGRLQPIYQGSWVDMTLVPAFEDYQDLYAEGAHRIPVHGLQTSRGCKFNCDFCSVIRLNGRRMRHIPVERVVEELAQIAAIRPRVPGGTPLYVHDDDLFSDRDFTAELFEGIIRSKIKVSLCFPTSIGIARDQELLELARRAGTIAMFLGLESMSRKSLLEANKKNRPHEFAELVAKIHEHRIAVAAGLIFGFDHDEPDIAEQTVDFLDRIQVDNAKFTALTPLPGTATFARHHEEGRIVTYDWGRYDVLHAVIQPERMTVQQLHDAVWRAYRLYYGKTRLARRVCRMATQVPLRTAGAFAMGGASYSTRLEQFRDGPAFTPDPDDIAALVATSTAPASDAMSVAAASVTLSARPRRLLPVIGEGPVDQV